jgi:hypothetical protein
MKEFQEAAKYIDRARDRVKDLPNPSAVLEQLFAHQKAQDWLKGAQFCFFLLCVFIPFL